MLFAFVIKRFSILEHKHIRLAWSVSHIRNLLQNNNINPTHVIHNFIKHIFISFVLNPWVFLDNQFIVEMHVYK